MDEATVLIELRRMIDEREVRLQAAHSELEALLKERIANLEDRVRALEYPPQRAFEQARQKNG